MPGATASSSRACSARRPTGDHGPSSGSAPIPTDRPGSPTAGRCGRSPATPVPAQGARRRRAAVVADPPDARPGGGRVRRRPLPRPRAEARAAVRADAVHAPTAVSGRSTPRSPCWTSSAPTSWRLPSPPAGRAGRSRRCTAGGCTSTRSSGRCRERTARGAVVQRLAARYPGDPERRRDAAAQPRRAGARRGDAARTRQPPRLPRRRRRRADGRQRQRRARRADPEAGRRRRPARGRRPDAARRPGAGAGRRAGLAGTPIRLLRLDGPAEPHRHGPRTGRHHGGRDRLPRARRRRSTSPPA